MQIVDVSAIAAALLGMIVRQVSFLWTVRNHRCVVIDRTPNIFT